MTTKNRADEQPKKKYVHPEHETVIGTFSPNSSTTFVLIAHGKGYISDFLLRKYSGENQSQAKVENTYYSYEQVEGLHALLGKVLL